MKVYVTSNRTEGTGGFQWRYEQADALKLYKQDGGAEGLIFPDGSRLLARWVGAVEVPDDVGREGITEYIDARPRLWDFDYADLDRKADE